MLTDFPFSLFIVPLIFCFLVGYSLVRKTTTTTWVVGIMQKFLKVDGGTILVIPQISMVYT